MFGHCSADVGRSEEGSAAVVLVGGALHEPCLDSGGHQLARARLIHAECQSDGCNGRLCSGLLSGFENVEHIDRTDVRAMAHAGGRVAIRPCSALCNAGGECPMSWLRRIATVARAHLTLPPPIGTQRPAIQAASALSLIGHANSGGRVGVIGST